MTEPGDDPGGDARRTALGWRGGHCTNRSAASPTSAAVTPERYLIELFRGASGAHGTIRREHDDVGQPFESWLDLLRLMEDPADEPRGEGPWQR